MFITCDHIEELFVQPENDTSVYEFIGGCEDGNPSPEMPDISVDFEVSIYPQDSPDDAMVLDLFTLIK